MARNKNGAATHSNVRPIQTVFYQGKDAIKITRSKWANSAVPNAVKHMQTHQYEATHCEVYDIESGILHAVLKMPIGGTEIRILFKREVKEGM